MTTAVLPTAKYDSINVEVMENWLKELESGETLQGQSRLHTVRHDGTEELCCLGVVSRQLAPVLNLSVLNDGFRVTYADNAGLPVGAVLEHLGIPESHRQWLDTGWTIRVRIDEDTADALNQTYNAVLFSTNEMIGVQTLNDRGIPFTKIAALLRKEFLNA